MAREAPLGLILRRGPSKQVCTIGWNRTNDTFELGQWLKGVIYEHRSDLSPDGKHFLYFAAKHNDVIEDDKVVRFGIWTAISRAPFLKALTFWGQGTTHGGGGHFEDDTHFWLNGSHGFQDGEPAVMMELNRVAQPPVKWPWGMQPDELFALRLERDGWRSPDRSRVNWEKKHNAWKLQQSTHHDLDAPDGRKADWESYRAVDNVSNETLGDQSWEWADFDGDRLVWAQNGKLFATKIWDGGHGDIIELADFNDWKFKNIVAPY